MSYWDWALVFKHRHILGQHRCLTTQPFPKINHHQAPDQWPHAGGRKEPGKRPCNVQRPFVLFVLFVPHHYTGTASRLVLLCRPCGSSHAWTWANHWLVHNLPLPSLEPSILSLSGFAGSFAVWPREHNFQSEASVKSLFRPRAGPCGTHPLYSVFPITRLPLCYTVSSQCGVDGERGR